MEQQLNGLDPRFDTADEDICEECGVILTLDNESCDPLLCKECEVLQHIQVLMINKRHKNKYWLDDFIDEVFTPLYTEPDWESFKIKKI